MQGTLSLSRDVVDYTLLFAQVLGALAMVAAAWATWRAAKEAANSANAAHDSAQASRRSAEIAERMLELAKSEYVLRIETLRAQMAEPVHAMLGATGSVYLWADPDKASGYVVATKANRSRVATDRPLRAVACYDPGQVRLCVGVLPEEKVALRELVSKRGIPVLDPVEGGP